jgi:hypothetical protein
MECSVLGIEILVVFLFTYFTFRETLSYIFLKIEIPSLYEDYIYIK